MEHAEHSIDLGAAEPKNEVLPAHIPSEIQADTLFTFMKAPEYLHTILQKAMISPRYCTEDIAYLHIEGISRVSIASVSGNLELDYGHVLVLLIQVVESKKQHDISSCCLTGLLGFLQLLLPVPDSH